LAKDLGKPLDSRLLLENLMNPEMQAALDNTKSVKHALDAAVEEIDRLLAGE